MSMLLEIESCVTKFLVNYGQKALFVVGFYQIEIVIFLGKGAFPMAVKRIGVPNGTSGRTSGLSFRNVQSGQSQSSQGLRQTRRTSDATLQDQQSAAYQLHFAPRSFFIEDDFNDITIEELAQFMEREDDYVEETKTDEDSQEQQKAPPVPDQPVDQRKVAAVAAYDWFATL